LRVASIERRRQALEHLVEQRTQALAAVNRQLVEASHTDPLTGVSNRRAVYQRLPQRLSERSHAASPGCLVLVLMDLDHFKSINDRHGHAAGDQVLQQLATRLGQFAEPAAELIARWGGEEFLLLFEGGAPGGPATLLQALRRHLVAEHFVLADGTTLPLTASFGFVEMPCRLDQEPVLEWERWLELADQALYRVKAGGRDGWAGYRPTTRTRTANICTGARPDAQTLVAEAQLEWLASLPASAG
jgi:diguanylate cyclase (GGDEF)-like protein